MYVRTVLLVNVSSRKTLTNSSSVILCGFETAEYGKCRERKAWSLFSYPFKLFIHWDE